MQKFVFCLLNIDYEKKIGRLAIKSQFPINGKFNSFDCEISSYLCGIIKANEKQYIGVKYTSHNQDKDWKSNPYKLKHFQPGELSNIPEHFKLEFVSELQSKVVECTHLNGEPYREYVRQYLKPKFYKRYVKCVTTKRLEDLFKPITIVPPNFEMI